MSEKNLRAKGNFSNFVKNQHVDAQAFIIHILVAILVCSRLQYSEAVIFEYLLGRITFFAQTEPYSLKGESEGFFKKKSAPFKKTYFAAILGV